MFGHIITVGWRIVNIHICFNLCTYHHEWCGQITDVMLPLVTIYASIFTGCKTKGWTCHKPPSTFFPICTIIAPSVVVLVVCGEHLTNHPMIFTDRVPWNKTIIQKIFADRVSLNKTIIIQWYLPIQSPEIQQSSNDICRYSPLKYNNHPMVFADTVPWNTTIIQWSLPIQSHDVN